MNPFGGFEGARGSSLLARGRDWALLSVVLISLAFGFGVVTWRTFTAAENTRARARAEALALANALELQISQAISAAEILGALVKQSAGTLSLQKAATELLATRPGVISVELQPGGVVSDVFPRAGNERAIGFNSLRHPAYRQTANAALQRRALTLAGPLKLHRGDAGLIALAPVYLPARDRSDVFWGFASATVAFPDMLGRAHINDLVQRGYNYQVLVPASAQQISIVLAEAGRISLQSAVHQAVPAGNLEFRVALQPQGGWVNKREVALECSVVLLIAGLLFAGLLTALNHKAISTSLGSTQQQLAAQFAARTSLERENQTAQQTAAGLQADLQQARSALEQARIAKCQLQAQLDEAARVTAAKNQIAQESLADADQIATDLRLQLDQTTRAVQQAAEERARTQALLDTAQKANRSLQTRLEEATRVEKDSAAAAQQRHAEDQATIADLLAQLEVARTAAIAHPPENTAQVPPITDTAPPPAEPELPSAALDSEPIEVSPAAPSPPPAQIDHAPPAEAPAKAPRARRRAEEPQDQMSLWAGAPHRTDDLTPEQAEPEQLTARPKEPKSAPSRAPASQPPPAAAELRRAFHQILPLLVDHDPGASDCLNDNQAVFQSAFAADDFTQFQAWTGNGKFNAALEHLKKAAKRHGIAL